MRRDYPRTRSDFEAEFSTERACRAFPAQLRRPDGFACPRCRAGPGLHAAAVDPRRLPLASLDDSRRNPPRLASASDAAVQGDPAGDGAEERRQRARAAADPRRGPVPDSSDLAPQAAARNGASGTGPAVRLCRGGRDLRGRAGKKHARTVPGQEVLGGGRCRGGRGRHRAHPPRASRPLFRTPSSRAVESVRTAGRAIPRCRPSATGTARR